MDDPASDPRWAELGMTLYEQHYKSEAHAFIINIYPHGEGLYSIGKFEHFQGTYTSAEVLGEVDKLMATMRAEREARVQASFSRKPTAKAEISLEDLGL